MRRVKSSGESIRKRFRRAQEAAGLTVRDAAKRAHVTPPTIMKIRNGGAGGMAIDILIDVARSVGVDPAWLVFGMGEGLGED